jgi:glutamate-1-semialdehyde 2,1-aminomutase
MQVVSPAGPMYQAGTLSGNPLAMAAGLAQLRYLDENPGVYTQLDEHGKILEDAVASHAAAKGLPVQVARVGSMGTVFFSDKPIHSWNEAAGCDTARFAKWFWYLMERGVYLPCAQYEAFFFSTAHTREEIQRTATLMVEGLDAVFG